MGISGHGKERKKMNKMPESYTEEDLKKMGFKSVGSDIRISKTVIIRYPEEVTLGNHVAIDPFVFISVKMDIGNRTHIASHCKITGNKESYMKMNDYTGLSAGSTVICSTDDFKGPLMGPMVPLKYRKITRGIVILEKYVVIGADSTILPNVIVGEGTITGAKTLVIKNLEPWGIYIGIPARRIEERRRDLINKAVREIEKKETS